MTNIRIGDRIFFVYTHRSGHKTRASGLVLGIEEPKVGEGPADLTIGCDTPGVWFGTCEPNSNRRIVHVRETAVWRLK